MIIARYDVPLNQSERAHLYNYLSNYTKYIIIKRKKKKLGSNIFNLLMLVPLSQISLVQQLLFSLFPKKVSLCKTLETH